MRTLLPGMRGTPLHGQATEGAMEVIQGRTQLSLPEGRLLAAAVAERLLGDLVTDGLLRAPTPPATSPADGGGGSLFDDDDPQWGGQ